MSASGKEWLMIALFFAMFAAVSAAEVYWLYRKNGIDLRRALVAVLMPGLITITLGFLVTFLIWGILLAAALDETTGSPGERSGTWPLFIASLAFPFLLMTAVKYLLVRVLRFSSSNARFASPFLYSLAASVLFFVLVVGFPLLTLILF